LRFIALPENFLVKNSLASLHNCGDASSIAANPAKGCGRRGNAELARFCSIAMGSASELEYHLLLAKDLRLLNQKEHDESSHQAIEVKRMLAAFISKLHTKNR